MSRNQQRPSRVRAHIPTAAGRKSMELVASVSRSSGLEKGGDALKDFGVQDEYREFMQEKLDEYWKRYGSIESELETVKRQRLDVQENILILFRKLREGIVSAQRTDAFALDVYETSLYLAVIFVSPRHVSSPLSYLVPDLYLRCPAPQPHRATTVVISLLYNLVAAYPSQSPFREHLAVLPAGFLRPASAPHDWVVELASALRCRNYFRVEALMRPEVWSDLCKPLMVTSGRDLAALALRTLIDSVQAKARETAWAVLRSAYRELACHAGSETRDWLARSLVLRSTVPEEVDTGLDEWLEKKREDGQVRIKEGVEGRWIVCKVR